MTRFLREEERQLWHRAMDRVKPLKGRTDSLQEVDKKKLQGKPIENASPITLPFSIKTYKAKKHRQRELTSLGVDARFYPRKEKIRGYSIPCDAKLDLHGYTAQQAFHRFTDFLQRAYEQKLRCVHIVTGLGPQPDGGILRNELPSWLQHPSLRGYVLESGYIQKGNPGATYVLLRRNSS